MEKSVSNRDATIDICKGIGILLVVLGHINFLFGGVIYHFHMAFFFILSGLCLKEKYIREIPLFIFRRAKTLLWPYFCFICISWCIKTWGPWTNFDEYVDHYHLLGTLWFLKYLFLASFLSVLFLRILGYLTIWYKPLSALLMLLMAHICSFVFPNQHIHSVLYVTSFVLFGFMLREYVNILKCSFKTDSIIINGGLLLLLLVLSDIVMVSVITDCDWRSFIAYGFSSLVGSFLVFRLSYYISEKDILKKEMIYLGQHTMPILLLQWPVLAFMDILQELDLIVFNDNYLFLYKLLASVIIPLLVYRMYLKLTWLHIDHYLNFVKHDEKRS